jgi:hypothetical protein
MGENCLVLLLLVAVGSVIILPVIDLEFKVGIYSQNGSSCKGPQVLGKFVPRKNKF